MGRPKRIPGQIETRRRILEAAEVAFGADGFDGATLQHIAAQAGIRRPSLLYHFASKQTLYSAVVEHLFKDLGTALADALGAEGAFDDRLDAVVRRFDAYVEARPQAAQLILREILDDRGSGHASLIAHAVPVIEMIERFLEESEAIPSHVPVREAVMAIASSRFVRAAAGPLGVPLWGPNNEILAVARRMFGSSRSSG